MNPKIQTPANITRDKPLIKGKKGVHCTCVMIKTKRNAKKTIEIYCRTNQIKLLS